MLLLAAGCDVDKARNDGTTPLFFACQKGHEQVVTLLHAAGCEVDKARNDGPRLCFLHAAHAEKHGFSSYSSIF